MKFPVFPEIELQLLFHGNTHPQHLLPSLCVLGRDTQSKWGCVHWWLQNAGATDSEIFYLEMATHLNIPVIQTHAAREAEHSAHHSLKMDSHPACWGACPPHELLVRDTGPSKPHRQKWFREENEPTSRELEVVIIDKWHSWMSIKQHKTLLSSPQLPQWKHTLPFFFFLIFFSSSSPRVRDISGGKQQQLSSDNFFFLILLITE